jgi:hypothetical protein
MKWRRNRNNHTTLLTEAEEVVREAERLLSGKALDDVPGHRRRAWALICPLAHSDRDGLQKLACARTASLSTRPTWDAVIAYLAGEVLTTAPGDEALVKIQRQVLIPLELKLLGNGIREPTKPRELVTLVLAVLGSHQS